MFKRIFLITITFFTIPSLYCMKRILTHLCCCNQNQSDENDIEDTESRIRLLINHKQYGTELAKLLDQSNLKRGYEYRGRGLYVNNDGIFSYSYQRLCCEPHGTVINN